MLNRLISSSAHKKISTYLFLLTSFIFICSCSTIKHKDVVSDASSIKQSDVPALTMPRVRRIWIPDHIVDDTKFEAGHFIYILEKTSTWSKPNDK